MRRIIIISLLMALVVQSTSSVWLTVSLYFQRDYIAQNLCINRFEAMPVCKGQCYINKKLVENHKKEQQLPTLKQKEIHLFIQDLHCVDLMHISSILLDDVSLPIVRSSTSEFHFSLFHPPQS